MSTLIINKTKNRSLVIDKTRLKKSISLYKDKSFVRKYINKTYLYCKLGVYVRTKSLGKGIYDSERNRKRKNKKKIKSRNGS